MFHVIWTYIIGETKLEVKEEENYDFDQQKNFWGD